MCERRRSSFRHLPASLSRPHQAQAGMSKRFRLARCAARRTANVTLFLASGGGLHSATGRGSESSGRAGRGGRVGQKRPRRRPESARRGVFASRTRTTGGTRTSGRTTSTGRPRRPCNTRPSACGPSGQREGREVTRSGRRYTEREPFRSRRKSPLSLWKGWGLRPCPPAPFGRLEKSEVGESAGSACGCARPPRSSWQTPSAGAGYRVWVSLRRAHRNAQRSPARRAPRCGWGAAAALRANPQGRRGEPGERKPEAFAPTRARAGVQART
jgi:hypothetical protein